MSERELANGWQRFKVLGKPPWAGAPERYVCLAEVPGDADICGALARYGINNVDGYGCCDSPACVEAMGVFAPLSRIVGPVPREEMRAAARRLTGGPIDMDDYPDEPAPEPTLGPVGEDKDECPGNCADCGEVDPGAKPTMAEALAAHVATCSKHPMAAVKAQLATLKVALDEAAEMLRGRIFTIAGAAPWLDRYADLKDPALEPRAARGQKGKR